MRKCPNDAVFAALTRNWVWTCCASLRIRFANQIEAAQQKHAVQPQSKRFRAVACQGPTVFASRKLPAGQPLTERRPATLHGIPENACFLELPAGEAL